MTRPLIVKGDATSHGGKVVGCSEFTKVGVLGVGRLKDEVICPVHGVTTIDTADGSMLAQDLPVARDGDTTSCGAVLISSQSGTYRS